MIQLLEEDFPIRMSKDKLEMEIKTSAERLDATRKETIKELCRAGGDMNVSNWLNAISL
jgi:hypothetical protein